jgi:hypothetical protein
MRKQTEKEYLEKRDYEGTSKRMEREKVARICKLIEQDEYKLVRIVHNNDASTMKQINDVFKDCKELLDVGYTFRNVLKKVKILAAVTVELKGYGERIKRTFQRLVHNAQRAKEKFKKDLDIALKHYCNDHSECQPHSIEGRKYKPLKKDGWERRYHLTLIFLTHHLSYLFIFHLRC